MANSQKCCCCNVFRLAKGLTITEIVLIIVYVIVVFIGSEIVEYSTPYSILAILTQIAYLVPEYIGIHMKNKCLIIFGVVMRLLEQTLLVIFVFVLFLFPDCSGFSDKQHQACETFRYYCYLIKFGIFLHLLAYLTYFQAHTPSHCLHSVCLGHGKKLCSIRSIYGIRRNSTEN